MLAYQDISPTAALPWLVAGVALVLVACETRNAIPTGGGAETQSRMETEVTAHSMPTVRPSDTSRVPAIDAEAPEAIQTATFALG